MIINTFPTKYICKVVACDTETRTYINNIDGVSRETNILLSDADFENWCLSVPEKTIREKCFVETWAWIVSDGKYWAYTDNFEEFIDFLFSRGVVAAYWYNAKFDFSQIDWHVLTGESWEFDNTDDGGCTALFGAEGQRYTYKFFRKFTRPGTKNKRLSCLTMYDLCNIIPGGLEKALESFNVVDYDGKPCRKLEMSYQNYDDKNALQYMEMDAKGLFHLGRICEESFQKLGFSIFSEKPTAITSGGLAKKCMLKFLYPNVDNFLAKKLFHKTHIINADIDLHVRTGHLYRGGLTLLNPAYTNRLIIRPMHRYDVNSMYPWAMTICPDIYGFPLHVTREKYERASPEEYEKIIAITNVSGAMRKNMLPVWYDPITKEYNQYAEYFSGNPILFYAFELQELEKWYNLEYDTTDYIIIRKRRFARLKEFIEYAVALKNTGKREKNPALQMAGKRFANSSYGKFAENPTKDKLTLELSNNAVRIKRDGTEIDEKCILSVFIGAWITARARVRLLEEIRTHTDNPARDIVYTDTDSIHGFISMDSDPYTLGAFKDEGTFTLCKYLAPKTYFDSFYNHETKQREYEIHTKGINVKSLYKFQKSTTMRGFVKNFCPRAKYKTLVGMNVKGGKGLFMRYKNLCKE